MAAGGAGNTFYTRCLVLDIITPTTFRVGTTSYIRSDTGYEVIPGTRWAYFSGSVVTGRDTIFIPDGSDEQDRPRRTGLCPSRRNSSDSAEKKRKNKEKSKAGSPGKPGSPGSSGDAAAAPFRRTFYIFPTDQRKNVIPVTGSTQGTLIIGPGWYEIDERSGILNGSELDPPVRHRSNSEPGPAERMFRPPLNRQGSDLLTEKRYFQISQRQRNSLRLSPPCSPRSSGSRRNTIPTSPLASSVRRNPIPRSPLATPDRRSSMPSSLKERSLSNSPPTNSSRPNMQSALSASSPSRGNSSANSLRSSPARRSLQSSISEASSARGSSSLQTKEPNQPELTPASPIPDEIPEEVLQDAGYATASRPTFWTRAINKLTSRSSTTIESNRSSATVKESTKAEPISSSSSSDTQSAFMRWCKSVRIAMMTAITKSDRSGTSSSRQGSQQTRQYSLEGSSSASGISPEFSELSSSDMPETETSEVSRLETPEKKKTRVQSKKAAEEVNSGYSPEVNYPRKSK